MSENTGGPAFPSHGDFGEVAHEGMTLRDYFAAKALQALISKELKDDMHCGAKAVPIMATFAYEYADAMLEARNK